jgi:hypothetical protein
MRLIHVSKLFHTFHAFISFIFQSAFNHGYHRVVEFVKFISSALLSIALLTFLHC